MKLKWHRTSDQLIEQHTDITIKDIKRLDCEKPSDLVFHHIFLTKDYEGPCVFVWGEKDSDEYHCEYVESNVWR